MCTAEETEPTSGGYSVGEPCMYAEDCAEGLTCQRYQDENGNDQNACAEIDDTGDNEDHVASGHCDNIGWESNDSGRREWCEDKCVTAGGQMKIEDTDRGTTKESCSVYNDDGNVDSETCTYIITRYNSEECDTECQPFGGVWDAMNEVCDWSDDMSDLGNCHELLREYGGCNTSCAPTGYMAYNSETNMDECTWDNLEANTLVIDYEDPEEMYAGEDEHCGHTVTTTGEDEYIICMDGLVCQPVEDSTATDTYGYTMICVNDTTNYGEGAAGEWHSNSTNATGFNGTGYWFSDFTWVSETGMLRGTWDYDSSSYQSGTWTFD